ncbi:hypothetical protein T09_14212 [Trichinella sp. T9]|nr:hypothetical protein T09_14212 [Trichinella sp. T9]
MLWQIESTCKLVFATTKDLRLLGEIKTWGMDGIFKAYPCPCSSKPVPVVYCLCSGLLPEYSNAGPLFLLLPNATTFLPVLQVHKAATRLEVTADRLLHWNVYNVNIRTDNYLEAQQKSDLKQTQALQTTPTPGDATVGDIRRVSSIYDKKQCRVIQYTGKHTNGRLTMEQLLEALMYTTPESI